MDWAVGLGVERGVQRTIRIETSEKGSRAVIQHSEAASEQDLSIGLNHQSKNVQIGSALEIVIHSSVWGKSCDKRVWRLAHHREGASGQDLAIGLQRQSAHCPIGCGLEIEIQ